MYWVGYCWSGLFTVTVVEPCDTDTSEPFLIASITVANVANAKSSPTLANIEPSITPIGGTKKLPIIKPILNIKQTQKAQWFIFVYIDFIDIIFTFFHNKNRKKAVLV